MRRLIIDTDTGSDDAVALLMALQSEDVTIEAVTTVAGNVPLPQATLNALMTIEVAGSQLPPVYAGSEKPLVRAMRTAESIHGKDGMGGIGLIHPTRTAEHGDAVDIILDLVRQYPGEIELVVIGPATNIAHAIRRDRKTMEQLKCLFAMGTTGFGRGNMTPVAEFNVFVDAEAFEEMLGLAVPMTIIGFDTCLGACALTMDEIETLRNSDSPQAQFMIGINRSRLAFNQQNSGNSYIHLPDAVAMAAVLWPDVILESEPCSAYVCTREEATYGQVLLYDRAIWDVCGEGKPFAPCVTVCKQIDGAVFKSRLLKLLTAD